MLCTVYWQEYIIRESNSSCAIMVDCLQSHLKEHHTGANVQLCFLPVQIKVNVISCTCIVY